MPSLVRNAGVGGTTANLTGLNATNNLTVCLWARLQGTATGGDVLRHSSTANLTRDGYRILFRATEFGLDILGSAGSSNFVAISGSPHRDGRWHHFCAVFDTTANAIYGYLDGKLRSRAAATQNISANAACTTSLNPGVVGSGEGFRHFDLQILPDVIVPPQDVPLLMNPDFSYPGIKGRYYGKGFRTTAGGTGALVDESGNGNNLTLSSTVQQAEEPPYKPTYV